MAFVNFDGLTLRITLDPPERRAVHLREFVVPRECLASVAHSADVWSLVQHDITLLGLGFPGIVLWGTAETRSMRDFCIIKGPGPGLVIGLRGHTHDRVLLGMPDARSWPLYVRLREVIVQDADDRPASG